MKKLCVAAVFLAFASPAFAADKVTLDLTPNEIGMIAQGLGALDGYHKVVKGPLGRDQDVVVPYDIAGGARLTIAHDESKVRAAIQEFQAAAKGMSSEQMGALANQKEKIELLTIGIRDLNVNANPYPPSALSGLAPILTGLPK